MVRHRGHELGRDAKLKRGPPKNLRRPQKDLCLIDCFPMVRPRGPEEGRDAKLKRRFPKNLRDLRKTYALWTASP